MYITKELCRAVYNIVLLEYTQFPFCFIFQLGDSRLGNLRRLSLHFCCPSCLWDWLHSVLVRLGLMALWDGFWNARLYHIVCTHHSLYICGNCDHITRITESAVCAMWICELRNLPKAEMLFRNCTISAFFLFLDGSLKFLKKLKE